MREDLLTRCAETDGYYNGLGLQPKDLLDNGFSASDLEMFLTEATDDKTKYHISAFWKPSEVQEGVDYLNRWRAFINSKAGNVIGTVD